MVFWERLFQFLFDSVLVFTDCLCLGGGDEDLLLLLSSLSCLDFRVVLPDFCNDGSVYFFFSLPSSLLISLM